MAHPVITFTQRYELRFKVLKTSQKKIQDLLNKNGFINSTWMPVIFDGFYEVRVDCNIRQAELIRQLLKNFKLYD